MLAKAHSTMLVLPLTNTQVSTSCAHAMYGGYRTMTAVCTYMYTTSKRDSEVVQ